MKNKIKVKSMECIQVESSDSEGEDVDISMVSIPDSDTPNSDISISGRASSPPRKVNAVIKLDENDVEILESPQSKNKSSIQNKLDEHKPQSPVKNSGGKKKKISTPLEDGEIEDSTLNSSDLKLPVFEVRFEKKDDFHSIGFKVLNAIKGVLSDSYELTVTNDEKSEEIKIIAYRNSDFMDTQEDYVKNKSIMGESANTTIDLEDFDSSFNPDDPEDFSDLKNLFKIDTQPSEKLNKVKVPSYKRSIREALDEETIERKRLKIDEETVCHRPSPGCFNCGSESHSIRDCTKPRNNARINKAKKSKHSLRYHTQTAQRFSHFKPGELSKNARDALGLRRGELPFFFYRMRSLGYPPGWLIDAEVEYSGIALFNSNGDEVPRSDEEDELTDSDIKYDAKKIIDFPGYNKHPGSGFYDDYKYHKVPAMNKKQFKNKFIKSLGDKIAKSYKLKKLKEFPTANTDVSELDTYEEAADMEVEETNSLIETDVVFSRPPPPAEPADTEKPPPPPSPITTETISKSPSQENLLQKAEELASVEDLPDGQSQRKAESPTTSLPTKGSRAIITESHVGTPILHFSPYEKLPNGENFKVGVSDVINFENLPDSTGTYEHMKGIITKVRKTIKNLRRS